MPKFIDLSGQKFNRLTVVRRAENIGKSVAWLCLCDCGNSTAIEAGSLKRGNTKSCGCLNREQHGRGNLRHGHSTRKGGQKTTKEYNTWQGLRARCTNPSSEHFADYGGRGIYVCERWCEFDIFLADMGLAPTPTHTIERRDNDGPYSPDNCYWATKTEQARNKRTSVFLECRGRRLTVAEWSEISGVCRKLIYWRAKHGWDTQDAVFLPAKNFGRKPG